MASFQVSKLFKNSENDSGFELNKFKQVMNSRFKISLWQTGLGKIFNLSPLFTGSQMVVIFSDNTRIPMNCIEHGETIFAIMNASDIAQAHPSLTANSAVQIWMKNGWFNATGQILSQEDTHEKLKIFPPDLFFGKLGASIRNPEEDSAIRLMEIRKVSACTGENGPGEYAWVWAAASAFFFLSWISNRKK